MQIGATICSFLAGVIFTLVVLAIPPAIVEYRHDARMAMVDTCHVLEIELPGCDAIVAAARRPTGDHRTCET